MKLSFLCNYLLAKMLMPQLFDWLFDRATETKCLHLVKTARAMGFARARDCAHALQYFKAS